MTAPSTTSTALLALAEHHDDLPANALDAFRGALLPHLDEATSRSYLDEAVGHLRAAADIRDGSGDWRALVTEYLTDGCEPDDAPTGREDALELAAAERVARVLALAALDAAVRADLAALAVSMMDEAAELLDVLSVAAPDAAPAPAPAPDPDPFAALERNYAAEDAFARSPHGLEIAPHRTSA